MLYGMVSVQIVIGFLVFVVGTIVGSFCNVVLLRKNTGETMMWGRSRCFSCGRELLWYDNIPIISFVFLRGRCRFCQSKISWQYPIVEAIVGLLALVTIYANPAPTFVPFSIFYFAIFIPLFLVAAYDARTKIVDRHLLRVFAFLALTAAFMRWMSAESGVFRVLATDIIAAASIWFFFWAFWFFSHGRWMGRGDSSVALWCALLLGFPLNIAMLLVSYWVGGLVGLCILAVAYVRSVFLRNKRLGIQEDVWALSLALEWEIPFVPFLALGTFAVWFFEGFVSSLIATFFVLY